LFILSPIIVNTQKLSTAYPK